MMAARSIGLPLLLALVALVACRGLPPHGEHPEGQPGSVDASLPPASPGPAPEQVSRPRLFERDCCSIDPSQSEIQADGDPEYCYLETYQRIFPRETFFFSHQIDHVIKSDRMATKHTVPEERARLVEPLELFVVHEGISAAYDGVSLPASFPFEWIKVTPSKCSSRLIIGVDSRNLVYFYGIARVYAALSYESAWSAIPSPSTGSDASQGSELRGVVRSALERRPDIVESVVQLAMLETYHQHAPPRMPRWPAETGELCETERVLAGVVILATGMEHCKMTRPAASGDECVHEAIDTLLEIRRDSIPPHLKECAAREARLGFPGDFRVGLPAWLLGLEVMRLTMSRSVKIDTGKRGEGPPRDPLASLSASAGPKLAEAGLSEAAVYAMVDEIVAVMDPMVTRRLEERDAREAAHDAWRKKGNFLGELP